MTHRESAALCYEFIVHSSSIIPSLFLHVPLVNFEWIQKINPEEVLL